MSPIKETLSNLKATAAKLNEETGALNTLIEDIEKELEASKVGLTVWLDMVLDEHRTVNEEDVTIREGWDLGYTKVGDHWRIAVKQCQCAGDDEWVDLDDPIPLANAPRIVRVEAAPLLERLLILLHERMKLFITNIQTAKNLASK